VRGFSAAAARVARRLGRKQKGPRRRREDPVLGRRGALQEETGFWDYWLATHGEKWPEEYRDRFDREAEVTDPALRELLASMQEDTVTILDVGAGPATTVGLRFEGMRLAVTAVDPLAGEYDRLLARHGVSPPVRTEEVEGEQLLERFGPAAFDIAYSRNALDHAVDPMRIIENMVKVVRPAGYVLLRHVRNEAVNQDYVQLHQWNFDLRQGRFVVWRPGQEIDVGERLSGQAETRCWVEDEGDPHGWLVCLLRKPAGGQQG
jgi:SAM-dependent methyltransferase